MSFLELTAGGLKVHVSVVDGNVIKGTIMAEVIFCIISDPVFQVLLIPEENVGKSRDGCLEGALDPETMTAELDTTQVPDGMYLLWVHAAPRKVHPLTVPESYKVEKLLEVKNL